MPEFAKITRRGRSVISDITYILLNILLAIASTALIIATNSWFFSILLVVVSKWRIFAVRPRYWFANIKSNLVDFIVGVSYVMLIYHAVGNDASANQATILILTILYVIWLLFIKPKSSEIFIEIQAGTAVLLGLVSASMSLATTPSIALVACSFIIGYASTRHILISRENTGGIEFMSVIAGIVMAELSWVCYHWLIAYDIGKTGIKVSQFAIIAFLISFMSLAVYKVSLKEKPKLANAALPITFSVAIIIVVVLMFSQPIFAV